MRYRALILTAFAVLACAPGASAARHRTPPLVLHARSQHSTYPTGATVRFNLSLTNRTGKATELANLSTGAIVIDSVRRTAAKPRARQVRLRPVVSEISYDDGLPYALLASLRRVRARSTLRFGLSSGPSPPGQGLYSIRFNANSDTLASIYSLAVPGRYRVTLHYRFPGSAPHQPWYGGSSSQATLTFRIRATRATKSPLVRLSDLARSSRAGRSGPAAVAANIRVIPESKPDFVAAVTKCINQFQAPGGDPDNLLPTLLDKSIRVFVGATTAPENYTWGYTPGNPKRLNGVDPASGGSGLPTGSVIGWDPSNTTNFQGTDVARDPCAELYHEFFHAYQNAHGTTNNRKYVGSKLPTREVKAVRAENDERKAKGLPLRTTYDGLPIPLPLTTPPPTPPGVPPGQPAGYPCSGEPVNDNQPCFLQIEVNGAQYNGPEEEYGIGVVTVAPGAGEPTIAQSSSPQGGFRSGSPASQYNDQPGCFNGNQSVGECYQLSWSTPTTITLTAHPMSRGDFGDNSPDYDSKFVGWGGDCVGAGAKPSCTLAIGGVKGASGTYSLSVIAYFQATDTGVA